MFCASDTRTLNYFEVSSLAERWPVVSLKRNVERISRFRRTATGEGVWGAAIILIASFQSDAIYTSYNS